MVGMSIWVLKQDLIEPEKNLDQCIIQVKNPFDHMKLTLSLQTNFIEKDSWEYTNRILQLKRFERFILSDQKKASSENSAFRRSIQAQVPVYDPKQIKLELSRLRCKIHKVPSQFTFYLIAKIATHMLE